MPHQGLQRTTTVLAVVVVVVALAAGGDARADEAADALTPPRVIHFVEAPRPEGADAGVVAVELELTIGVDGALTDAQIAVSAGEAFDAAALAAVRQFIFEPARRGARAVPARIRYRYTFEAVEAISDAGAPGDGAAPQPPDGGAPTIVSDAGAPADTALPSFGATASIAAPPREVTKRTLGAEELTNAAGTRGDALRVVELLPGVARPPYLQGFLLIRGSGPDDSQVVFEGGPVDRLYHFGGLTSFTNARLLDHIDLYPGNFSARYGRKVGGIVDVGVRDPKRDAVHSVVDVNLIDASVLIEGRSAIAVPSRSRPAAATSTCGSATSSPRTRSA
ncbi:MAG TPA: TonB family protein [Polyangia bacterium]|jgi:TonB family protein|nr:TonB family protein [Polyangia bacterium]